MISHSLHKYLRRNYFFLVCHLFKLFTTDVNLCFSNILTVELKIDLRSIRMALYTRVEQRGKKIASKKAIDRERVVKSVPWIQDTWNYLDTTIRRGRIQLLRMIDVLSSFNLVLSDFLAVLHRLRVFL